MALKKKIIGFVGAGNMAQAMIKGIMASDLSKSTGIIAYDVNQEALEKTSKLGAKSYPDSVSLACACDVLVLAVKPQVISEAIAVLPAECMKNKLIISIAAGIKIARIHKYLNKKSPVVRVMPNTPALTGEGACAYCVSLEVKKQEEEFASALLSTFCKVCVKVKENEIDSVTALSGSGPAYFFYFAEAMLLAAKKMKLSEKTALSLIVQTITGSGKLLEKTKEQPAVLRAMVTSKGGTTQSALESMEKDKVKEALIKAVLSAHKRAKELGR